MDSTIFIKIYINHRFKLIMLLDLLTVALGVVASIFLGKASDPFAMLNGHYIEILEFLVISLVIYTISFYLFGTNKSLWSYLGVNEIVSICISVVLGDLLTSILYQYMLPDTSQMLDLLSFHLINYSGYDVYKNVISCLT